MTVRGLAERTKECYTDAIARMARHYHRSPDLLSPGEVEAYLLHLVKDRKLSYSSVNHAASASRFLFEAVLQRKMTDGMRPPMARVPQRQPYLLAREEIARLFACCAHPAYRMALQTIYAAGLRVSEVCALRVADIDSAADRMCVRVNAGKGGADRYSILSPTLLDALRCLRPIRRRWSRRGSFCAAWRAWMRSSARAARRADCGWSRRWEGAIACPRWPARCGPRQGRHHERGAGLSGPA